MKFIIASAPEIDIFAVWAFMRLKIAIYMLMFYSNFIKFKLFIVAAAYKACLC